MKTIYLDTQDYSRFANVLLGGADSDTKQIFDLLLARVETGEIRPVYSMVILSELLQYHPDYEAETFARAEAIELLCRGWCCINPSRLMAREAAILLSSMGLERLPTVIQSDNNWTPNLATVFDDFIERTDDAKKEYLREFRHMNRKARRIAEKGATDRAFSTLLNEAAPIIAEEYGLTAADFRASFLMLHKRRITPEQASKRFFSSISRPRAFVHVYFKKVEGNRDFPKWISSSGEKLVEGLPYTVEKMAAFDIESVRTHLPSAFGRLRQDIAKIVLNLGSTEISEFGVSEADFAALKDDPRLQDIAPIRVYTDLVKIYLAQTVGVYGSKAKIERGLGGDLMHALYVPYVDIWRTDVRFSDVASKANLSGSAQVCSRLTDLVELI